MSKMTSTSYFYIIIFIFAVIGNSSSSGTKTIIEEEGQSNVGDISLGLMTILDNERMEERDGNGNELPLEVIPLLSMALKELIPQWKFPYRIVFRMEILALRDQGTPEIWPNLIMGFDLSTKKTVPSRINLKVFHLLSSGFEFGIYHKWFMPNFKYGCSTEYLFQGEKVHEAMIPATVLEQREAISRILETILAQGGEKLSKIYEKIFTKINENLQEKKETMECFCEEKKNIKKIGNENEQKKMNSFWENLCKNPIWNNSNDNFMAKLPQKCDRIQIVSCHRQNDKFPKLRMNYQQPIQPIHSNSPRLFYKKT